MIAPWESLVICYAALCFAALDFSPAIAASPDDGKIVTKGTLVGCPTGEHVWLGIFGEAGVGSSWTRVTDGRFEVRLGAEGGTLVAICKYRLPLAVDIPVGSLHRGGNALGARIST